MKRTRSKSHDNLAVSTADKVAAQEPRAAETSHDGFATPVRIVVVDDHRFMRELISAMLARQSGRYHVVAEHGDARTAIRACEELKPDLLILDINLPDLSGIEAVPKIKKLAPNTRILLCTAFVTDERVIEALRCGADGFVEKTNTWEDFIEAIEHVSNGEHFFRAQSSPALAEPLRTGRQRQGMNVPSTPLSQREQEVLTLITHGNSTKQIASKLGVSIGTVESHRTHMMRKLNLHNVAELVVYAFRVGLIKLPLSE
jgi:DNA-binding NarL/FixJ family response regulator